MMPLTAAEPGLHVECALSDGRFEVRQEGATTNGEACCVGVAAHEARVVQDETRSKASIAALLGGAHAVEIFELVGECYLRFMFHTLVYHSTEHSTHITSPLC